MCVQSCMTLWNPMGGSPPCLSTHGIFQAKMLEEVAIFLFQGIFLIQGSNPHLQCLLPWQARFFTQIFYCVKSCGTKMPISGKKGISFPAIDKEKQNKSEVLDKKKNKVEISEMEVSRIEK